MMRTDRSPLAGLNTWIARTAGREFRGMNEQSALNRARSYLRNTGQEDAPITVEPPKGESHAD